MLSVIEECEAACGGFENEEGWEASDVIAARIRRLAGPPTP